MRKVWKIAEKILIAILIIAVLASALGMFQRIVLKEELPSVFGYKRAMVLSGSMEPTFAVGDMVIFKEQAEYEIGDVVIFHSSNFFITHRIIDKTSEGFVTKGDANNVKDADIVPFDKVEGKMIGSIGGVGNIAMFFQTPIGLACLIAIGFVVIELPDFIDKRKKKKEEE